MTLTFKDSDGREWELRAHRVDYGDSRFAEPADLLAALGQLSTGSDGPTDARVLRALYAAGAASRQTEVDRLTAERDEDTAALRSDVESLESELAATKAKLAEVERELSDYKADAASAEEALREDLGKERSKVRAQRAELHSLNKLRRGEVEAAIALRSELASARRVVEAALRFDDSASSTDDDATEAALLDAVAEYRKALASAGTDADRAEAPRDEAGESEDVLGKFDRIRGELEEQGVRIRASEWLEPTEEPKPEPQPSGGKP